VGISQYAYFNLIAFLQAAMKLDANAQAITYATEDLAEGVKALQEKRQPTFTGK
jgi:1,4-dihydroxy-2-naphthoyl-CoA synthase